MASLLFVKRMPDLQTDGLDAEERDLITQAEGRVILYRLSGPISFGAAKALGPALPIHNYDAVVQGLCGGAK